MPPGGGRVEYGWTGQRRPPATAHRGRGRDVPSHSSPPLPCTERSSERKKLKHGHQHEQRQPAWSLSEGPLVEILARVPYTSLCRFKCVSKSWLALCSDPKFRKRCPQTVSGFFFLQGMDSRQYFRNLSGRGLPLVDPCLPFLRQSYQHIRIEQCCGGLLLCRCWNALPEGNRYDRVVCNPATKKWNELPSVGLPGQAHYRLGFDAAAPSCFVVLVEMRNRYGETTEMAIYSSEAGRWTSIQSNWGTEFGLADFSQIVFLNGTVHFCSSNMILTMDSQGKACRKIEMPHGMSSIGQSQGHLYAWHIDNHKDCRLYVWILEDYATGKWTLKLNVDVLGLFGRHCRKPGEYYELLAVHLEYNLIFLTDTKGIVSYDMASQNTRILRTCEQHCLGPAVPYIPCFAEWLADGN